LLETEGPEALTMRRIASAFGCSTSVLYTMFGGKAGIADGLWREGFRRLTAALNGAARIGATPLDRLEAIANAYRDNALANRAYYSVMFQRPIPRFQPSEVARAEADAALAVMADAVAECIAAGDLRGEVGHITWVLWAAAHGAVSLEIARPDSQPLARARFEDAIHAAAAWFRTQPV
jgi:AcrR family transcriptional regulator